MKNIIKLLVISIFLNISTVYAVEGCVVSPQLAYETNQACVYSAYNGTYDPLDPCYQQYLQLKSDYAARCKVYWDNIKVQNSQPAPTSAPQVIEVYKEVVVTATPIPAQRNYKTYTPTETPIPTNKPLSITPSPDNYYQNNNIKPEKKSFIKYISESIFSFFISISQH